MISKTKKHTDKIENVTVSDAGGHGVSYRVFSNVECRRVVIENSKDGFRFHNSDGKPSIEVAGARYNLVMRECETVAVKGDGLYVTKVNGALIENCKFCPPTVGNGDCVQFAFEKQATNISRNILVRGCIMLQGDLGSQKGAVILERARDYTIENSWLGGNNFSLASTGDDCVVRSNRLGDARSNDYSFGYGISERHNASNHHVYDNLIERCRRGISLSGFKDQDVRQDGVTGYQRAQMRIHDNVVADCDIGFFADRAWSGAIYRNIFLKCRQDAIVRALGEQTATIGAGDQKIIGPIYTNDGSFRCEEAPGLRVEGGVAKVTPALWSARPDDLRYIWRIDGIDVPAHNMPIFHKQDRRELSCIVLARKGDNWMLAIAEQSWREAASAGRRFVPRSFSEGYVTWGDRYV